MVATLTFLGIGVKLQCNQESRHALLLLIVTIFQVINYEGLFYVGLLKQEGFYISYICRCFLTLYQI